MAFLYALIIYMIGLVTGIVLLWLYICMEVSKDFIVLNKKRSNKQNRKERN